MTRASSRRTWSAASATAQVRQVVYCRGGRVKLVGELLKGAGCVLDLVVYVCHDFTLR